MNLFAQFVFEVIVANVPLHTIFEHLRIQSFPSFDRHMHTTVAMAIRATFALKDQVIQRLPISFFGFNSELLDPFWHLLVEVHRKWTHGRAEPVASRPRLTADRFTSGRALRVSIFVRALPRACAKLLLLLLLNTTRELAKSSQDKSSQGAK